MPDEKPGKSEAGEFTGRYTIEIITCNDVHSDIPTARRVLNSSHSNSDPSIPILRKWAVTQVANHLESHELWKTPSCQPSIFPVCEVHTNAAFPNRVVWVPLPNA